MLKRSNLSICCTNPKCSNAQTLLTVTNPKRSKLYRIEIATIGASAEGFFQVQKFRSEKNKVKVRRKLREPQFCFQTRSDVDVLDDGYKWRKYGQKVVKNSLHPSGLQIREALKLQLDVSQRCLHEQLKVQRKLQLRIEEQGRQLK